MTKKEELKNIQINFLTGTVFIKNSRIMFSYTPVPVGVNCPDGSRARYFGGLQCMYMEDTPEYKNLEGWLCDIAEFLLKFTKQ